MFVDPPQNQVRDPQVVLVLHQHVAVAEKARVRKVEHRGVASIEIRPTTPTALVSAASSGKKPDSECPIKTAPFS
jgi:hypothetical protein